MPAKSDQVAQSCSSTDRARSRIMASVGQRSTQPEVAVRASLRRLGIRYRCNVSTLPGSPDIVVRRLSLVVFVHGCFWHRHICSRATTPKSNRAFWQKKFIDNQARDRRVRRELRKAGWSVAVIWECWTRDAKSLDERVRKILLKVAPRDSQLS